MTSRFSIEPELDQHLVRWQWRAAGAGAVLLLLSVIGAFFNPDQFFRSYLFGYLFWIGVTLGSMALLMVQYLTGGAWGVMTRRAFEAASRTLPVVALLFLPIVFGIPHLYPWAHHDLVAKSDVMRHRAGYMNTAMFLVRAVLYFAVWFALTYFLNLWSAEEDERGPMQERLEAISAPGLILYVFLVTFSMVDWAESLFPEWYSTMWGFLFVAAQGLTAMCFAIAALTLLSRFEPLAETFRSSHLHDLGKLLLMFVMLWAYFAFSQLLIVWEGNLTNEIPWYMPRWHHSWVPVGAALILLEFFLPFFLLLSKSLKKSPAAMAVIIAIVLVMRMVDLYWMVMPDFYLHGLHLHWLQFTLPLSLGGLWVSAFVWQLRQRPLLPLKAINLEEALHHAG